MRVNKILVAILASAYSVGVGAAVEDQGDRLQSTSTNAIVSHQMLKQADIASTGSINSVTKPPINKFQFIDGLVGAHTYAVVFKELPISHYGKKSALQSSGKRFLNKIDTETLSSRFNSASAYQQHLLQKQASIISQLKSSGLTFHTNKQFTKALNGFTLTVNQHTAQLISQHQDVEKVLKLGESELQSYSIAQDIGAETIWQGGSDYSSENYKGEGIVIGVLDTGINSDHISFIDAPSNGQAELVYNFAEAEQFYGECSGNDQRCNNKLIGIRSYQSVTDAALGNDTTTPLPMFNGAEDEFEYQAGEDYHGHGSHVASIIAGNIVNDVSLHHPRYQQWQSNGTPLKVSSYQVSGVAPNAQIISYQVCDPLGSSASCRDEVVLQAIEDAITDGVDVINFSIAKENGANQNPYQDAVEMAFLNAHQAGIVVVAAVGNGDNYSFTKGDHASPWLISVGVSDKSDSFITATNVDNISGGDPQTIPKKLDFAGLVAITNYSASTGYTGDAFTGNPVAAESVLDTSLYSTAAKQQLSHCIDIPENTFSSNEIAVCLLNNQANTDFVPTNSEYEMFQHMALVAENAGAGGVIIMGAGNVAPALTVNYNNENFPATFMRSATNNGEKSNYFYDWVLTSNELQLDINTTINPLIEYQYPTVLGMVYDRNTSMGPGEGINGEHLLPAVIAPGVNILAANADQKPFNVVGNATDWLAQSGSSTATAVVAGAAALVKQAHPEWSPAEIISALTLTAKPGIHIGNTDKGGYPDAYTMGAGLINVERAINTGLVMRETVANFMAADPQQHNISDLNIPAAIERACFGSCSLTRTFTATKDGTWRSEVFMDYASASASVSPATFTLSKGESIDIQIDIKVVDESVRVGWDYDQWHSQYDEDTSSDIINNDGNLTGGDIVFIAEDKNTPEVHLPLAVETRLDIKNDMQRIDIETNQGSKVLPLFSTDDVNTAEFTVYQPAVLDAKERLIHPANGWDDMSCYLYHPHACVSGLFDVETHIYDKTAIVDWVRVPAGAKRLFAEGAEVGIRNLIDNRRKNSIKVAIGRDLNKNAYIDFREEILCISDFRSAFNTNDYSPGSNNFCSITDPDAGDYWVMYQWASGFDPAYTEYYKDEMTTTIRTFTGVVSGEQANAEDINIVANDINNEVTVNWDIDLTPGQSVFTAFNAVDNNKTVSLNLNRVNDIALLSTTASALDIVAGSTIDMVIDIKANFSDSRQFINLNVELPEGATLVGNVLPETNSHLAMVAQTTATGFKLSGAVDRVANLEREYVVTTNLTDDMCRTPTIEGQEHGGFVDLNLTPITGSAMRLASDSNEHYLLSPMGETIISNVRRMINGEVETDIEWAARVHKDQWGPFNWMATQDEQGQQYIDREHVVIDLEKVFDGTDNSTPWISFFGNSGFAKGRFMYLFGNGFIDFQNFAGPNPLGTQLPNYHGALNFETEGGYNGLNLSNTFAPLWRAAGFGEQFITPFIPEAKTVSMAGVDVELPKSGISVGSLGSKLVLNYDNVRTGWKQVCKNQKTIDVEGNSGTQCTLNDDAIDYYNATLGKRIHSTKMEYFGNDNYDIQVFMETGESKNRNGDYEVVIAYNDISRSPFNDASMQHSGGVLFDDALYEANIGLLGHEGYKNSFGGVYHSAEHFNSFKATDRSEIFSAVKNNRVVCFDYQGPEAKAGKVRFKVKLADDITPGEELIFNLVNSGSNAQFTNSSKLLVASSLSVAKLSNAVFAEDSPTQFVTTALSNTDVFVEVSSSDRHIDVSADVDSSSLIINISSAENYFTDTPATISVTVVDNKNSKNMIVESFTVEVTPINDAPELFYENDSYSVMSDEFVEIIAYATDPDPDTLVYHWSGEHIDPEQVNNASINLSNLPAGSHQFVLTVSDGTVEVSESFNVEVTQAEEKDSTLRSDPDGGSTYWLTLFALVGLLTRRTLLNK